MSHAYPKPAAASSRRQRVNTSVTRNLVQTAISVFGANATVNANIMQGVVTGIGFIGAGAIIRQGDFTTGHATAASIWTVGIMGAAVGYGSVANLTVLMLRMRSSGG
jgi:putative Mg2+ transporter-C (MgtC) family protein